MLSKKGISRVVWERQWSSDCSASYSSDKVDLIPYLNVH